MTADLSIDQVLALQKALIDEYGGAQGQRDESGLESAVARPQMTFDGEDLCPGTADKAAALWHSLVMNHPFIDGNKRIGAMTAELFLGLNGIDLRASDEEIVQIMLTTARGETTAEALAIWIRQRSRESPDLQGRTCSACRGKVHPVRLAVVARCPGRTPRLRIARAPQGQ